MTRNEMLRKRNQAETPETETSEKKEDINAGYLEMRAFFDGSDDDPALEDFEK